MKIQIESRWPRVLQSRLRRFVVAAIVTVFALGVPAALAIHDFTDVPDANPFHDDIAAIKRAGVTSGKTCVPPGTPPTYCPAEPITREAMAAFMHRGAGRIASEQVDFVTSVPVLSETEVTDADVTVGGVAGQQLVYLQATFTAFATVTGPCNFGIRLYSGTVAGGTLIQTNFDEFSTSGANQRTFTISDVVLATSGFHSYALGVVHDCSGAVSISGMNMIAATFAFGGNGTNIVIGSPEEPGRGTTPAS